jgi:hypothetical protein
MPGVAVQLVAQIFAWDLECRRWRHERVGRESEPQWILRLRSAGYELLEEACKDFNGWRTVKTFDPESPMTVVFMPKFLIPWWFELSAAAQRALKRQPSLKKIRASPRAEHSFTAQRDHWINFDRAACGNHTGQHCRQQ